MPRPSLDDPGPVLLRLSVGVGAARAFYVSMDGDIYVKRPIGVDRLDVNMGRVDIVMCGTIGMCFGVRVFAGSIGVGSYRINVRHSRKSFLSLSFGRRSARRLPDVRRSVEWQTLFKIRNAGECRYAL